MICPAAKRWSVMACARLSASLGVRCRKTSTWRIYHVQTRGPVAAMERYVNVPAMPTEPRVVPVQCPLGQTGGLVYAYYIDAPPPALVSTVGAASPERPFLTP